MIKHLNKLPIDVLHLIVKYNDKYCLTDGCRMSKHGKEPWCIRHVPHGHGVDVKIREFKGNKMEYTYTNFFWNFFKDMNKLMDLQFKCNNKWYYYRNDISIEVLATNA